VTGGIGYSDYWYNLMLCSVRAIPDPTVPPYEPGQVRGPGIKESQVAFPSLTVMVEDCKNSNASSVYYGDNNRNNTEFNRNPSDSFSDRHFDGINYAFVDGHVKWYRSSGGRFLDQINNRLQPFTNRPTFRSE
jgi:prepilin-type processing-associated H-X9-DG protein